MVERIVRNARFLVLIALGLLAVFTTGLMWVAAPMNQAWLVSSNYVQAGTYQNADTNTRFPRLLKGKLASLGWIVGRDCQRGIRAYLQTATTDPDAALVGTGWVNPLDGTLI